jgi:hypothetical protein
MRKIHVYLFCALCFFLSVQVSANNQILLTGKALPGGVMLGKVPMGSKILFNKKPLKLTEEGDFVIGFDRDSTSGDVLHVIYPDGQKETQHITLASRTYDIQRVNGVSAEIQSSQKSAETWERIRLEQVAVEAARAQILPLLAFKQTFRWPVIGPITGVFGSQRVYNGELGRPHYGVDVGVPTGTSVVAPADGVITLAHEDMYYSGGTIILDHGFQVSSTFIHLSKVLVKAGDVVKQGDIIGLVGATGRATGPHLDWRMNWMDRRVDPQLLVPSMHEVMKNSSLSK